MEKFDIYRSIPKNLLKSTTSGSLVSLFVIFFSCYLFLFEIFEFLNVKVKSSLEFEHANQKEISGKLKINLSVTFPRVPCSCLAFGAQDVMGSTDVDVSGHLFKISIDKNGQEISRDEVKTDQRNPNGLNLLSLYATSSNSADFHKIQKEIDDLSGCKIAGFVLVNKVPGNFHFLAKEINFNKKFDVSHKIETFYFGDEMDRLEVVKEFKDFPAIQNDLKNPLDGLVQNSDKNFHKIFEYYVKIVPSLYKVKKSKEVKIYQISANSNAVENPLSGSGVYFRYDISPVSLKVLKHSEKFSTFLVRICSMIGGIYTVAGLLYKSVTFGWEKTTRK